MENLNQENQPEVKTPQGFSDVYVMPEKFRPNVKSGGNFGIIISASVLLAVILLTGGYFAYDSWQKQQISKQQPIEQPPQIQVQQDESVATTTATTTEDMATTTATTTLQIATTTATTTLNQSGNINVGKDSDNDGLTDAEEVIFGTAPTNPDSDGDSYKDGVEVFNGYSPTAPGNVKISQSPFVTSITTNFDENNFKVIYPKDWRPSLVKSAHQLILTVNTGEVITITVKPNTDKVPAMAWYLQQHPQVSASQLRIIESGDLAGIFAPDGMSAYLTDKEKNYFYVFEYNIGQQTEFRYPTIFTMIVKQFVAIANPAPVVKPQQQNSSTVSTDTAATCSKFFCATQSCGPIADGTNTCETNPPKGVCYEKECESDSDCSEGLACQPVDCYSGDAVIASKVCK